jgi:hypothetical protein
MTEIALRDRPHVLLGNSAVLRCCMQCNGQTRDPFPAKMVHESTCKFIRKLVWQMPTNWKERFEAP